MSENPHLYVCSVCSHDFSRVLQPLYEAWGYKRGELEGKNVIVLMPQPFSGKHNTFLRNYINGGEGACPGIG